MAQENIDLKPNSTNKGKMGGLVFGNVLGGLFNNADTFASIFSQDYRDNQLAIASQENQAYANALAVQNSQKNNKPNYIMYIAIAVVVLLAIYLLKSKK